MKVVERRDYKVNQTLYLSQLLDKYNRAKVVKTHSDLIRTKLTFKFPDETDTIDYVPNEIFKKFKLMLPNGL